MSSQARGPKWLRRLGQSPRPSDFAPVAQRRAQSGDRWYPTMWKLGAEATTNPVVVMEVLSPSSEGDDEGDKRLDFQSLASLRAYVVAAQDQRCVKIYRRGDSGEWRSEPDIYRDGESFELPTLSKAIAVAEIYDGILDERGCSLLRR